MCVREIKISVLDKWGRTHMGSDGFNQILPFDTVGVRLVYSRRKSYIYESNCGEMKSSEILHILLLICP